jgi:hypothetical protein
MKPGGNTFFAASFFCAVFLGCEGEWVNAEVGKVSCDFRGFDDFLPSARRPLKMASGNNGNNLYILDIFNYVHSYKRDKLYECAFDVEKSTDFYGLPEDVLFENGTFYLQDGAKLISNSGTEKCYAKDGFFAIYGNELAVGGNAGIETWNIQNCSRTGSVSSQGVLALAVTGSEYYAVELQNLAMFSKISGMVYRDPMSSIPGNEKNFCSTDRLVANDYGVYLLDKKCKKIGIFDNQAVWRKSISLDSLRIRNPLDIAAGEYSYIFIMHESGVERVNVSIP